MSNPACPACGRISCIWAKWQIAGDMVANEFTDIVADRNEDWWVVVDDYGDGTFWSEEEYEEWDLSWPE